MTERPVKLNGPCSGVIFGWMKITGKIGSNCKNLLKHLLPKTHVRAYAKSVNSVAAFRHEIIMPQHAIRRANLLALVKKLNSAGIEDMNDVAAALGPAVTPGRLATMVNGGLIHQMACEAIEFRLNKPRGWFNVDRAKEIEAISVDELTRRLGIRPNLSATLP